MTDWKLIFSLSRINGADYDGDSLDVLPMRWPKGTWLQHRLVEIRKQQRDGDVEHKAD